MAKMTTTQKAQEMFGILWNALASQHAQGATVSQLIMDTAKEHMTCPTESVAMWNQVFKMGEAAKEQFLAI